MIEYLNRSIDVIEWDGGLYIDVDCCSQGYGVVSLEKMIQDEKCPYCGRVYKFIMSSCDRRDDSDRIIEELKSGYIDRKQTYVPSIDVLIDDSIVNLIKKLNRIGLPTRYCCSGVLSDHYDTDRVKKDFDIDTLLNLIKDNQGVRMAPPNIRTDPVYHDPGPPLQIDDEFKYFVNECLYPSGWVIKTTGEYIGDNSPTPFQYAIRVNDEEYDSVETLEEYDLAVQNAISNLEDKIEEFFSD